MPETKTINGVQVEAEEWKKHGKHRIYFSAGRYGKACWDVQAGEWIKVHSEFSYRFKAAVKAAFGL